MLKEILFQNDWTLIFQNLEDANEEKIRTGDFKSVNYFTLIERLKDKCSIELDKRLYDKLEWLRKERNKAENYQFVVSSDILKSNIVQLLSYLIPFLKDEMIEEGYFSSDDERFTDIKDYLHEFDAYVKERLKLIEDKVSRINVPIHCPVCSQETVEFTDETEAFCHFCSDYIDNFTDEYIYNFVDTYSAIKDGGEDPLLECPECEQDTFICLDGHQFICLSCGIKPTEEKFDNM
jgi:ribosomal protein S27E